MKAELQKDDVHLVSDLSSDESGEALPKWTNLVEIAKEAGVDLENKGEDLPKIEEKDVHLVSYLSEKL